MFLDVTLRRNPLLVQTAIRLHQERAIPPNTFVVDQDALAANARRIARCADELNLRLYFMTKQLGRNPLLAQTLARIIPSAVAVSWAEALALDQAGVPVGHVGHLVQPPQGALPGLVALAPEVVTVFSLDKARALGEAAAAVGRTQAILLRVVGPDDDIFPGQVGGLALSELPSLAEAIARLPGVRVVGVTSFPCVRWDARRQVAEATPNLQTLRTAARILRDVGLSVEQVNAPGMTCCCTLPLLAEHGVTHAEPGHGLTGTTPAHVASDQPEQPAIAYVSEVSHLAGGRAYFVGGGLYARGRIRHGLVAEAGGADARQIRSAQGVPAGNIDYYGSVRLRGTDRVSVGDTVVLAFRMQLFVGQSYLAVVRGLSNAQPELVTLVDSANRPCAPDGSPATALL